MDPTTSPLSIDIHRNSSQTRRERQPTNNEESLPDSLVRNPIVNIKRETECESILHEVHRREGLAGFIAMGIDYVGHDTGGPELNAKVDESETEDDWHGPGILVLCCLAPCEESDSGEGQVGNKNRESELRFVDTAILAGHVTGDTIREGFGDKSREERCDERRQIGETDLSDSEIVRRGREDLGDCD